MKSFCFFLLTVVCGISAVTVQTTDVPSQEPTVIGEQSDTPSVSTPETPSTRFGELAANTSSQPCEIRCPSSGDCISIYELFMVDPVGCFHNRFQHIPLLVKYCRKEYGFRWCDITPGQCVPISSFCDGKDDCKDSVDEAYCYTRHCANGTEIESLYICDGNDDCGDNSDEEQCSCASDEFMCTFEKKCIKSYLVCDGSQDCIDNTDESHDYCLEQPCKAGTFACRSDNTCLDAEWMCDGREDCSDGSDEARCSSLCQRGMFVCSQDKACVDPTRVCDGNFDCNDLSDEAFCTRTCDTDSFLCDSGECISDQRVCDGTDHCIDGSDENRGCRKQSTCLDGFFQCHDGSDCISEDAKCDGIPDCNDISDEAHCRWNSFCSHFCADDPDVCLSKDQFCDGVRDCFDDSDEKNCFMMFGVVNGSIIFSSILGSLIVTFGVILTVVLCRRRRSLRRQRAQPSSQDTPMEPPTYVNVSAMSDKEREAQMS